MLIYIFLYFFIFMFYNFSSVNYFTDTESQFLSLRKLGIAHRKLRSETQGSQHRSADGGRGGPGLGGRVGGRSRGRGEGDHRAGRRGAFHEGMSMAPPHTHAPSASRAVDSSGGGDVIEAIELFPCFSIKQPGESIRLLGNWVSTRGVPAECLLKKVRTLRFSSWCSSFYSLTMCCQCLCHQCVVDVSP